MVKIRSPLITLAIVFYSINGYFCEEVNPGVNSGCLNPLFIDKPQHFNECASKNRFVNQVLQNYDKMYSKFSLLSDDCKDCNLSELRCILKEMKRKILNIIDVYFNSTDDDPSAAILAAFDDYNVTRKRLTSFGRCGIMQLTAECSSVVQHIRQLPYSSGENILTSMLRCAFLKSQRNIANDCRKVANVTQTSPSTDSQNCLTIGVRPNPQSVGECFSEEFIATLTNFIADKYRLLEDTYNITSDKCDYDGLLQNISRLKTITYNLINLLKNENITYAEFDKVFDTYTSARDNYSLGLRNFILSNDKPCYYNPRKGRQFPLFLTDAIYSVLIKCIGYVDKSESRCAGTKCACAH